MKQVYEFLVLWSNIIYYLSSHVLHFAFNPIEVCTVNVVVGFFAFSFLFHVFSPCIKCL